MKAKDILKKFLCTVLALSSLLIFSSCMKSEDYTAYGSNDKNKVFYGVDNNGKLVDGSVMTEGMFRYFLSEQKSAFLMTLMYNDPAIEGDSQELWQRKAPDGKTYEEKFFAEVVKSAKELVAANTVLYMIPSVEDPKKSYSLPADYVEYIKALVLENAAKKHGSVIDFEAYLANFGATIEDYTALYLMTANIDLLKDALFNTQTGIALSDKEIKDYYIKNYYSANHIYINTTTDTKIDGTKAPLSQTEQERREKIADEIALFIKHGGSFADAAKLYSEEFIQVYENAAEMDINANTTNAPELGETLKKLEIGEVGIAKSAYGVHIIKRIELDPENFGKNEKTISSIYASLVNKNYMALLDEQTQRVITNENILSTLSLTEAVLP